MPKLIRMPISNVVMGSNYTATITIGDRKAKANVILDTGSSTLAVTGHAYNPAHDTGAKTTNLAQEVRYGSGNWLGAVVRTAVAVAPDMTLNDVNLAVTYHTSQHMFADADGILGLVQGRPDNAFVMPADTWNAKYDANQIEHGKPTALEPFFSRLEATETIADLFALSTKRSIVSAAHADPTSDPLNQGTLVIGGGRECTDLYSGAFASVATVSDQTYHTDLLSIQVGDQPPIPAPRLPPGSSRRSNSLVDSGTNTLLLPQSLYQDVIASFGKINADFGAALTRFSIHTLSGTKQTSLQLDRWPSLRLTLRGVGGLPAVVTITPGNYWQFDAPEKGMAIANIDGDGGRLGGESILGLPLFSGHFVVFDRTGGSGHGVIAFATGT